VEVNASGDFNPAFPRLSETGGSDRYGNGQPSLVYIGQIKARVGTASNPQLVGCTEQHEPVDRIDEDLTGITTARELLHRIAVTCTVRTP